MTQMVYAYLRNSTREQSFDIQKEAIVRYLDKRNFFQPLTFVEEIASGSLDWRERKLGDIIQQLQVNDVLVVYEIRQLARSKNAIKEIAQEVVSRKARIISVKDEIDEPAFPDN